MSRQIVFVHCSDFTGGAERSLCDLAAGLMARGHRVEVWNAGENPGLASWLAARDVPMRRLPVPRYGRSDWFGFARHASCLAWRWLLARPDLVHANNITSAKYALPAAAALRIPLVVHVRDEPQLDGLTRRILSRARLVLAISSFIAERLGSIPGVPVKILYNAVEVSGVAPAMQPPAAGRPLVFVTPTTYRPNKRIELILACASLLREAGCSFRWRVCGPRPRPGYFEEIAREHSRLELGELVELQGELSLEAAYEGADVVVSTASREPFGRTVIEAFARGRPVVGFESGALPELVETGVTGMLVPDGDVTALAAALIELDGERELIAELGRAGRSLAEQRFTLVTLLDAVEEHHASVL